MDSLLLSLSLIVASSVFPVHALLAPSLLLAATAELTCPQPHRWRRRPSRWPFGNNLGSHRRCIPWWVTSVSVLLQALIPPTPALLLFVATTTIIIVTIRRRRRNREQEKHSNFAYASHAPPTFMPSMPYGISRVRRQPHIQTSLVVDLFPL